MKIYLIGGEGTRITTVDNGHIGINVLSDDEDFRLYAVTQGFEVDKGAMIAGPYKEFDDAKQAAQIIVREIRKAIEKQSITPACPDCIIDIDKLPVQPTI